MPIDRLTVFLLLAFMVSACSSKPDETQIAQHIAAMSAAVETQEFNAIKPYLDSDFPANERLDINQVQRLLQYYGLRHKDLGVTILASETTLDATFPDRASTTLSVVVTGSSGGLPSDGSIRTVRLEWVRSAGDWLVRKADWSG